VFSLLLHLIVELGDVECVESLALNLEFFNELLAKKAPSSLVEAVDHLTVVAGHNRVCYVSHWHIF
jgi:hypothetical protein